MPCTPCLPCHFCLLQHIFTLHLFRLAVCLCVCIASSISFLRWMNVCCCVCPQLRCDHACFSAVTLTYFEMYTCIRVICTVNHTSQHAPCCCMWCLLTCHGYMQTAAHASLTGNMLPGGQILKVTLRHSQHSSCSLVPCIPQLLACVHKSYSGCLSLDTLLLQETSRIQVAATKL